MPPKPKSEIEHLRESRDNPDAFADFYERTAARVLRLCLRSTLDPETSAELTAETFAKGFAHRSKFRGSSDAEAIAWIFAIAQNELSSYFRKGAVRKRYLDRMKIEVPPFETTDQERFGGLAETTTIRSELREALSQLPASQSQAIGLRFIEDRSYPDIAKAMRISEPAARKAVSRGLSGLRGLITELGETT